MACEFPKGDWLDDTDLCQFNSMELLTSRDGKEVWFHQIERPFDFEPPFGTCRYVVIVFSNDETVSDDEKQSVTRTLFATGCRYGVFTGHACNAWELALDTTCIESAPDYNPSDGDFTMTTSHRDESVEDVIFFGLMCTSFDSHAFDRFLVLFVGQCPGLREEVEAALRTVWSLPQVEK